MEDAGGSARSDIVLEPLRVEHADEMVSVLAAPELYGYTGGTAPTLAELRERYRRQIAGPADGEEEWLNWIARTDAGHAVGFVQASVTGEVAEIAWLIGVEHQGLGYGHGASQLMARALTAMGVQRLVAYIHPDHRASQRIAEQLGLTRTGEVDDDGEEVWA